jgi:hypothetical protein
MNFNVHIIFVLLICSFKYSDAAQKMMDEALVYRGTSDASAAVAISEDMFIVADDENNILRGYSINKPDLPVFSCDLTDFLNVESDFPEADIEGATMIGSRIYWITSHGRNEDGKMRPSRYRFFATDIGIQDGNISIQPVGKPCKTLLQSMLKDRVLRNLGLAEATRLNAKNLSKKDRQKLAPKEKGLNIEALCASADGKVIYIGFRNPRPKSRALLVPLYNPKEVVEKSAVPILGKPILLDLNNLGVRSMEYCRFHQTYFIIAGPYDEGSGCVLYRWSAEVDEPPKFVRNLNVQKNLTPEAVVCFPNSERILLLSDDGSLPIKVRDSSECMEGKLNNDGTCPNKFLVDPNKKTFRAIRLIP